MPVTHVIHDLDTRTLTITAEFAAPVDRIWQVYADPGSSSRCSVLPPIRPPSSNTTCPPAAEPTTS